MASEYQFWDDGEMLPPVPSNAEFRAEKVEFSEYGISGCKVTAYINGQPRPCGIVFVDDPQQAIEIAKRDVCR